MKLVTILLAGLISGSAMANTFCDNIAKAKEFSASVIIDSLECAQPTLVTEDINALFNSFGICKEPQAESVDFDKCSTLAAMLTGALKENLPVEWECSMMTLEEEIRSRIIKVCGEETQPEPEPTPEP